MKILYVASIMHHINAFHIPFLKMLKENGWEVHVAANNDETVPYCDKKFILPLQRSPYKLSNILAYKKLNQIIYNERYDIVHCHTPVASILTRFAARKMRNNGLKVYYTAHGFHFYKGAPLIDWLLYFPVEWLCSFVTDVLITINREDYRRAKKYMYAKKVAYIPGIGVDTKKFSKVYINKDKKREELGIPTNDIILLSVGELNKRKNHEIIINALASINSKNIHYCIVGKGELDNYLRELARKNGMSERVHLLGYRKDINELCFASDIFIFPSKREGLGIAALEAMCAGLPIITSNVQGITDYSINGVTGYTCNPNDINGFIKAIKNLSSNIQLREKMGKHNKYVVLSYDISNTLKIMNKIYKTYKD